MRLLLWGTVLAGANFVYHAGRWLEGGLTFSYEKFITDIEMIQIIAEAVQPVEVNEHAIGFDAIAEVEPAGHFFAAKQTMERYRHAFYVPLAEFPRLPAMPHCRIRFWPTGENQWKEKQPSIAGT